MQPGPVKQIFINLMVKDLKKSMAFFQAIGFTFNPQFTDEKAACCILGENVFAMLIVENFFKTFTKKTPSDAAQTTEVLNALSVDSKAQVDDIVDKALKSGGSPNMPTQNLGWMYTRNFQDPDGHIWEVLYIDKSKMPGA